MWRPSARGGGANRPRVACVFCNIEDNARGNGVRIRTGFACNQPQKKKNADFAGHTFKTDGSESDTLSRDYFFKNINLWLSMKTSKRAYRSDRQER